MLYIAVIIGSCFSAMSKAYLRGLSDEAVKNQARLLVYTAFESFEIEDDYKRGEIALFGSINFDRLDGLIFLPNTFTMRSFSQHIYDIIKKKCTVPYVIIDHDTFFSPDILIGDEDTFEELTDHMIDAHHFTDIVCLTGPENNEASEQRIRGFRRSMERHGLHLSDGSILYGDFWTNTATEYAKKLTGGAVHIPQAVICGNDMMALTLCRALTESGWEIPARLAIAGYDGTDYAFLNHPRVTSYEPPYTEAGAEAIDLLLCKCREIEPNEHKRLCGKLLRGATCGCTRCNIGENAQRNKALYTDALCAEFYDDRNVIMRIAASKSTSEFVRGLYTNFLPSVMDHTLCLRKEWQEPNMNTPVSADEIMLEMKRDGSCREFAAGDLLPPGYQFRNSSNIVFFTSLHFKERFFGYSILQSDEGKISFESVLRRFTHEVNMALEELSLRTQLQNSVYHMHLASIRDPLSGIVNWNALLNFMLWLRENTFSDTSVFALLFISADASSEHFHKALHDHIKHSVGKDLSYILLSENRYCIFGTTEDRSLLDTIAGAIAECEESAETELHFASEYFLPSVSKQDFIDAINRMRERADVKTDTQEYEGIHRRYVEELKAIRIEIYEHPELSHSKEKFAQGLYVSPMYFQKLYKNMFGIPFNRDLIQSRLKRAKKLLLNTTLTITEIGERCGYNNLSYFMRQFGNEVGMTPTAYRKKHL